ncbi:unnamed protein product [Rotaria sp. Silwood2]|nr:unnamed protein product [Rotaria sp. Silwood2]CAF3069688.1 unnamed protein product [Rotaria sp. Silwood2]CAF3244900.1 unnamed protein product [Rotaria sp. Silwood2]CAF4392698.1 unnamed protein product [Rotaria sp. Silwood2]CAF4481957.1 unnamed protein product [Rotaria sp. Silwood2]
MSSTAIAIFPSVHEIYQGIAKNRRKAIPAIPQSCIFDIPEEYTLTIERKQFLLLDETRVRRERLLIFSSDIQVDLLFNSPIVYMDGTFSKTPTHFFQLFIVYAVDFDICKLQQHYLIDETFRLLCRKMMTLALMPLDKVVGSFEDINNAAHCLSGSPMLVLLKYFENHWISNTELWNLFGPDSRINNTCEGGECNLSIT